MAIIVNLFAGPGSLKSTTAAGVFTLLKLHYVNCELITEFAKDLTLEERKIALNDQYYIFGKQHHRLKRLESKVDIIIVDSPLLVSILYRQDFISKWLDSVVLEAFNSYTNINILLERNKIAKYVYVRRNQSELEALDIDDKTKKLLDNNNIEYISMMANYTCVNKITNLILSKFNKEQTVKLIEIA